MCRRASFAVVMLASLAKRIWTNLFSPSFSFLPRVSILF